MVVVAVLYMIIASTFTIGKLALHYLQPLFFVGIRMVLSGCLLLGYVYCFRRSDFRIRREHYKDFAALILFHIFLAYVCEFWALKYLSSSRTCMFYNLAPFLAAIFSYFWFAERMTVQKWVGLGIGFVAFLPVLFAGTGTLNDGLFLWPELAMLISVMSSTFAWVVVRKLGQQGYSMFIMNGVSMLGGGIIALATSLIIEGRPTLQLVSGYFSHDLFMASLYVGLLILLSNVIFYNLYGYLLRYYTVTLISFVGFLTPMFAALYGWVFLGESVGLPFFVTLFFVCLGLYLFYREELRQGYIVKR
jgi:drug/metabolite transporter (DMT)-like permease